jgi:serine protease Do
MIRALILSLIALGISPAYAETGNGSLAPLVKQVSGAVVNITSFVGRKDGKPSEAVGSGFIVDGTKGYVVTNNHVVENSQSITVNLPNGDKYKATIVGRDSKADVAVIKLDSHKTLEQVKLGDSDKVEVGDRVMAIGDPFELAGSVSTGIISAKDRDINEGPYDDFFQTDAAINKGNSGGPLFNMNGEVIAMNTAIISPSSGSVGIGFAIPSRVFLPIVDELARNGKITRGYIGVVIQLMTDDVAVTAGLPANTGALVSKVDPTGPAAKAGLKDGDIIVQVDSNVISTGKDLPKIVSKLPVGKEVTLKVFRQGNYVDFPITVSKLPEKIVVEAQPEINPDQSDNQPSIDGMTLETLSGVLAQKFGYDDASGVVVLDIQKESPADAAAIEVGNVILEVNHVLVNSPEEALAEFKKPTANHKALILIKNQKNNQRYITLPSVE